MNTHLIFENNGLTFCGYTDDDTYKQPDRVMIIKPDTWDEQADAGDSFVENGVLVVDAYKKRKNEISRSVWSLLNEKIITAGFSTIESAAFYSMAPGVPTDIASRAKAYCAWRVNIVTVILPGIDNAVNAGTAALPAIEEVLAGFPQLILPA